jgi:hypothetical protein
MMIWLETLVFWSAVVLTIAKVMKDTWNGTLRRELLALAVGLEVAIVVALALLVAS